MAKNLILCMAEAIRPASKRNQNRPGWFLWLSKCKAMVRGMLQDSPNGAPGVLETNYDVYDPYGDDSD